MAKPFSPVGQPDHVLAAWRSCDTNAPFLARSDHTSRAVGHRVGGRSSTPVATA